MRERLEALGHTVTAIVPTGGSVLPITGRYFAGAGGHGARCALSQIAPAEVDLVLLPDSVTAELLARHPQVLRFIRGNPSTGIPHPLPVVTMRLLTQLLDCGSILFPLSCPREKALAGPQASVNGHRL